MTQTATHVIVWTVGVTAILGGLSLLAVPLATNGGVPLWQKVIHWTSAIAFVAWGHACFRTHVPVWLLVCTAIGGLGCLEWSRRYVRMMRRSRDDG